MNRFGTMTALTTALGLTAMLVGCSDGNDDESPPPTTTAGGGGSGGSGGSGGAPMGGSGGTGGIGGTQFPTGGAPPTCETPPNLAPPSVVIDVAYDQHYDIFDLGTVPGVPDRLGGCVIKHDDPNTLLIVGDSETPTTAIYSIGVTRGPCGHILGWDGVAQKVADTPYADANLVYTSSDLMFYSQWPQYKISQMLPTSSAPDVDTDLIPFGIHTMMDQGPGGLGLVPGGQAAGELRIVTWPGGRWYHVGLAAQGNLHTVTGLTETTQLINNPGGFAYVPAGSPGFAVDRLIVSEWSEMGVMYDRVSTYEIDPQGDPIPSTRLEFLNAFERPWGAYFEPETGDFLFLQWGISQRSDRVFIVQGFVPPPDIPPPP